MTIKVATTENIIDSIMVTVVFTLSRKM